MQLHLAPQEAIQNTEIISTINIVVVIAGNVKMRVVTIYPNITLRCLYDRV